MNRVTKGFLVFLAILMCVSMTVGTSYAKSYKGLFLYWRGETPCGAGFKEGLKNLGYNVEVVEFNAEQDPKKLEDFLSSVKEEDYDFVYSFSTTVAVAAGKHIKKTPLFFGVVTDPVKSGLIQSWDSSGNNVTGVSHTVPFQDQVAFIMGLGEIRKIAMIYNPDEQNAVIAKDELEKLLGPKGVTLQTYPVNDVAKIQGTVSEIVAAKPDLVYLPSDTFILTNGSAIIPPLSAAKIPTYGALEKYIDSEGAMIGIVSSYRSVGLELANSASKVLNGQSPSDVPSKTLPSNMQTIKVGAKTAEQTGYEIPYQILSVAQIVQ